MAEALEREPCNLKSLGDLDMETTEIVERDSLLETMIDKELSAEVKGKDKYRRRAIDHYDPNEYSVLGFGRGRILSSTHRRQTSNSLPLDKRVPLRYDWPGSVTVTEERADEPRHLRPREQSDSEDERYTRPRYRREERWNNFKRTPMKPNKFDGSTPLETFIRQFEVCARYNEWTDADKGAFLQCALEKGPAQLLWDFGARENVTYRDLVERLRQRYGLEAQQETFRTQLRCRKQREKESLADLLHDIRKLVALAFPGPTNDTTEIIAKDAFLEAMSDRELSLKVREREPRTLDEAYRAALRLESYKRATEDERVYRKRYTDDHRQVRATTEEDVSERLFKQLTEFTTEQRLNQEKWQREMERLLLTKEDGAPKQVEVKATTARDPAVTKPKTVDHDNRTTQPSFNWKRQVQCYKCQGRGHLARDCRRTGNTAPRRIIENRSVVRMTGCKGKKRSVYVKGLINEQ